MLQPIILEQDGDAVNSAVFRVFPIINKSQVLALCKNLWLKQLLQLSIASVCLAASKAAAHLNKIKKT